MGGRTIMQTALSMALVSGLALTLVAPVAGARDIRPPLQAKITAQTYGTEMPTGPVAVRPISDTMDNEQVIPAFKDALELMGRPMAEDAALTIAFETETIWPYKARSTLTSQHLNSSINKDRSSFSSTDNRDFRVLGEFDQGDVRLPTYKLTVELRQIGRVVWRGEALSSHTNADPAWVYRQMVPVVLETVNTVVEGETFFLE